MTILRAARTLGRLSGWRLTNLEMQKTLYIAHMIHLAENDEPLFAEVFEAWDYGPAVGLLHRYARTFGREPVQDVFKVEVYEASSVSSRSVSKAWEIAKSMTAGQLVNFTHQPGGAWEQVYQADQMHVVIPNDLIKREWDPLARASDAALNWAEEMAREIETSPSRYVDFEDERSFRARVCREHLQ